MKNSNSHIIIYTLGTMGDVLPFINIALELSKRNYCVTLLTCEKFAQYIPPSIHFISIADTKSYQKVHSDSSLWLGKMKGMRKALKFFYGPAIYHTIAFIKQQYQKNTNITVIGWGAENCAGYICKKLNIPYIGVILAPSTIRSELSPSFPLKKIRYPQFFRKYILRRIYAHFDKIWWQEVYGPFINRELLRCDLTPICSLEQYRVTHYATMLIGLFPKEFCNYSKDWPVSIKLIGFYKNTISIASQEYYRYYNMFHIHHKIFVIFIPGSGIINIQGYFDVARQACRELNIAGIFINPTLQNAYLESQKILQLTSANIDVILKDTSVIFHHGGIGTCADAIKHNVPQIICPRAFDQFDNGYRIRMLRLGRVLEYSKYTVKNVKILIRRALNVSTFSTANTVSMHASINYCCDTIEKVIHRN